MDKNGYPEESELKKIREWDIYKVPELMEYIEERWKYADCGYWQEIEKNKKIQWLISTAGWSGNEDIIDAMMNNTMFWMLCWVQTSRGGHYIFELSRGNDG